METLRLAGRINEPYFFSDLIQAKSKNLFLTFKTPDQIPGIGEDET